MAFYFRTWKMSVASIAGLFFTVVVTVGIYAALGFEIIPSAIIGFLTILSYSLYDSVVVFDKIRTGVRMRWRLMGSVSPARSSCAPRRAARASSSSSRV